jgi:hypothetical protein
MKTDQHTKGTGDERLLFKNFDEAAARGNYGGVQSEPSLATGTATHDFCSEPYTAFHFIDSKTHNCEPDSGCD